MPLHTWNIDRCDCGKACSSPAKHPRTMHGLKDATADLELVARWWGQWPSANVGVATGPASGLVVVDIDPRNGGMESWMKLREEHDFEHSGPACISGGGGMHLYFRHPGTRVISRSGEFADGVDVKGDGGYVVAPPSIHASGTAYSWIEGYAPWEREPQDIPVWLLGLMQQAGEAGKAAAPVADRITQGKRRTALLSLAGSMRNRNMGETAIFNALMAENAEKCDPPLETQEIAKLAASAGSWEPGGMAFILPSSKPIKEKAGKRTPDPYTLAMLEHEHIDPVRWAVPGVLPEGCAICAGSAKLGKSFLMLGLMIAVGTGQDAWSFFPTEAGDCLYLALEDTKRRLKTRTKMLIPEGGWPARVWCETIWPTADEGGIEAIETWLGQHPEARLVVIDTFALFKPQSDGKRSDIYAADYAAVSMVKQVADKYGVCIVLITHLNKGDHDDWVNSITGSTGISGSADTLINLSRPRKEAGQGEAQLLLTGRDVEEQTWAAQMATGVWKIMGDLEDMQRVREYDETRTILRRMYVDGIVEVTAAGMAKASGKRTPTCNRALQRAWDDGFIVRQRQGTYTLKDEDRPLSASALSESVRMPMEFRVENPVRTSDGVDADELQW